MNDVSEIFTSDILTSWRKLHEKKRLKSHETPRPAKVLTNPISFNIKVNIYEYVNCPLIKSIPNRIRISPNPPKSFGQMKILPFAINFPI